MSPYRMRRYSHVFACIRTVPPGTRKQTKLLNFAFMNGIYGFYEWDFRILQLFMSLPLYFDGTSSPLLIAMRRSVLQSLPLAPFVPILARGQARGLRRLGRNLTLAVHASSSPPSRLSSYRYYFSARRLPLALFHFLLLLPSSSSLLPPPPSFLLLLPSLLCPSSLLLLPSSFPIYSS